MLFARIFNGIGLALVIPAIQSLVADSTTPEERGKSFGWLGFAGNVGSIVGGTLSVLLAGSTFFGFSGWRIAFHLTALVSYLLAYGLYKFTSDPVKRYFFYSCFTVSSSFF